MGFGIQDVLQKSQKFILVNYIKLLALNVFVYINKNAISFKRYEPA